NESLIINSKEYVVDRFLFDNYLLNRAKNAGTKIMLGNEFIGEKNGKIILNKFSAKTKTIIGCDGPSSLVNKHFGIIKNMNYFLGKQYVIKAKSNADAYSVYFDEFFKDFFAWKVPVSGNCVRIGVASKDMSSVNKKLEYFMNSLKIKGKILETNAGLIPLFNPFNSNFIKKNDLNVYLYGDACGLVKATTGGGIIPAFKSIDESLINIVNNNSPNLLNSKKELLVHLLCHKIMCNFKNKDYDSLIKDAKSSSIKNALEKINRDNLALLAAKIFIKNPKLLKYFKFH
ncbi:MAG: NAD(P)/FAD-dependent oxidoreductase, partial [Candidatus Nanoarchaeia archaeon]|nr:NAD(P)/FAD-dependent oxidoreductase [Candidatus Nanoarchaeia archaeon]